MKNIFRILMAVAVLFTASCAKEDISSSIAGGEANVTFTVDLPELGTRAYGDGNHAKTLKFFVYEYQGENVIGNYLPDVKIYTADDTQGTNEIENTSDSKFFKFSLTLIKGMRYNIVFWADKGNGSPYVPEYDANGNATGVINVNYTGVMSNDDTRDAFFGSLKNFGPADEDAQIRARDIKLYRPFAQLNAATKDLKAVENSGVDLNTLTSEVTVNTYRTLNLFNGDVSNPVEVTFAATAIPAKLATPETLKDGYDYLSMNYVLVNTKELVEAELIVYGKTSAMELSKTTYTDVPLQRNYKTNILGSLITKATDFTVEIKPGFETEEYNVVPVANVAEFKTAFENANVEGANTEISISDNINLADLTRAADNLAITAKNANLVINGNGYTLTYEGQDRAIDVTNDAKNTNLTLKNVTIDCVASYCQRGVNYNTNGALTLEGVTIKGKNVTYALNLPGLSSKAKVTINNSNITGNIALNVWGQDMLINAKDSHFTSVDTTDAEDYVAINLNNDGTTIANGTVVNIKGGSITARDQKGEESTAVSNNSYTGVVNISDTTAVVGKIQNAVAVVLYDGSNEFYSCYTLEEAIEQAKKTPNCTVKLLKDVESSKIIVLDSSLTLDGNGKSLTSTAERAINVSGANGVTIKNLTINASGERAINVIQNAKSVTLDNVNATSANYTVNVAASAPEATINIENSNLTGLNTVNIGANKTTVVINNTVITTNDQNESESYAAIAINAGGTESTVTMTGGEVICNGDSIPASIGASGASVTFTNTKGVENGVEMKVAAITYPGSDYYYSFATLEAAIEYAKAGDTVQLLSDITLDETLVIPAEKNISLDLNGKTLAHKDAATDYAINNLGTLTIKDTKDNGTVNARGIYNGYGNGNENVATAKLIIENGTFNAMGTNGGACIFNYGIVEITGGKFESNGGYGLNNRPAGVLSVANAEVKGGIYNEGTLTINNSTIDQHLSGKHAIYNWQGNVTINSGNFDSESGNELIFADGTNASVVINNGTFNKTAKSWLYAAATGKNISFVINGGTHNGYVNKPEMTVDTIRPYGDPIVVTGGTFNFDPTKWLATDKTATKNADGRWTVENK